jgi:hypothetical protein
MGIDSYQKETLGEKRVILKINPDRIFQRNPQQAK